jgi:TolB-like protein/Tfp pilus assembly protein PilF
MIDPGPNKVSFFAELRGRGVLRVAASYGAIAWLLVQIVGTLAEPFDLPGWVLRGMVLAAVIGFPVAVALAWFLEFTPQGVSVDRQPAGVRRPVTGGLRRYADVTIIGLLLLVVGYLVARQPDVIGLGERPTVAVLPFDNVGVASDNAVLATGIAESVLHQLANLQQLDVISRTSSFAFRDRAEDAREIGRQLKANYLLEGSVQSDRTRLRVTARLVDARTGADVWSMRFDRRPSDVFNVQDEIALQVTQALELTLDADARQRMRGQGTDNLDAYLALVQARTLLAADRVADAASAMELLQRAIDLDPAFAAAYVALAEAGLFLAEYDVTEDRQERFEQALEQGDVLIARALQIDADNGEAYLVRASMTAYRDLAAAEADYRRGLALSPNAAKGYHGLATVLYETPARRDEALAMLDRARKLDPLQPLYDVTRAVFLLYERGDVRGANDLLVDVLRRRPEYQPALARLTELRIVMGLPVDGIEYGERALALDPLAEGVRRRLVRAYLDVGDLDAAERVADSAPQQSTIRRVPTLFYRREWSRAGEAAYEALARQTITPFESVLCAAAIRMYARRTGDFERARLALETLSGVEWGASGAPVLPDRPGVRDAAIGLADVLLAMGRAADARRLLAVILDRMHHEVNKLGRAELWYQKTHPMALALAGDREAALAMLERSVASRFAMEEGWYFFEIEPAYDSLRDDPRFEAMRMAVRAHIAEQRRELDRRRSDGRVETRGSTPR